jgi:hypothetical protein
MSFFVDISQQATTSKTRHLCYSRHHTKLSARNKLAKQQMCDVFIQDGKIAANAGGRRRGGKGGDRG